MDLPTGERDGHVVERMCGHRYAGTWIIGLMLIVYTFIERQIVDLRRILSSSHLTSILTFLCFAVCNTFLRSSPSHARVPRISTGSFEISTFLGYFAAQFLQTAHNTISNIDNNGGEMEGWFFGCSTKCAVY